MGGACFGRAVFTTTLGQQFLERQVLHDLRVAATSRRPLCVPARSHSSLLSVLCEQTTVAARTLQQVLDEMVASGKSVDGVKVDIQGAEVAVISSVTNWHSVQLLVFEYDFQVGNLIVRLRRPIHPPYVGSWLCLSIARHTCTAFPSLFSLFVGRCSITRCSRTSIISWKS